MLFHFLMNTILWLLTMCCGLRGIKRFRLCCYWKITNFGLVIVTVLCVWPSWWWFLYNSMLLSVLLHAYSVVEDYRGSSYKPEAIHDPLACELSLFKIAVELIKNQKSSYWKFFRNLLLFKCKLNQAKLQARFLEHLYVGIVPC